MKILFFSFSIQFHQSCNIKYITNMLHNTCIICILDILKFQNKNLKKKLLSIKFTNFLTREIFYQHLSKKKKKLTDTFKQLIKKQSKYIEKYTTSIKYLMKNLNLILYIVKKYCRKRL